MEAEVKVETLIGQLAEAVTQVETLALELEAQRVANTQREKALAEAIKAAEAAQTEAS